MLQSNMLNIFLIIVLFSAIYKVNADGAPKARYDNYRVYSLSVETGAQLAAMKDIEKNPDGFRFLESPIYGTTAELLVPPHKIAEVQKLFQLFTFKYSLKTANIQR